MARENRGALALLGLLGFGAFVLALGISASRRSDSRNSSEPAWKDETTKSTIMAEMEREAQKWPGPAQDLQNKREAIIDECVKLRIFRRINTSEGGSHLEVWAGPEFSSLPFGQKKAFLSVVAAFYFRATQSGELPPDAPLTLISLRDHQTGNEIGSFFNVQRLAMLGGGSDELVLK